jgi:hypothetical protein
MEWDNISNHWKEALPCVLPGGAALPPQNHSNGLTCKPMTIFPKITRIWQLQESSDRSPQEQTNVLYEGGALFPGTNVFCIGAEEQAQLKVDIRRALLRVFSKRSPA